MEEVYTAQTSEVALEAIINNAVQIPGVKVDRLKFLGECFAKEDVDTQQIIDLGPIGAGCTGRIWRASPISSSWYGQAPHPQLPLQWAFREVLPWG